MVLPFIQAIDFSRKDLVRWALPPAIPLGWTKKKIDDEIRDQGGKLDVELGGYDILKFIGFEMEISRKVARGKFTVNEKACEVNGQLMKGVIDYIAESIASAAGNLASESGRIAGVELNLSHLRPAYVGQEVTAIATPLTQARSYQVWEVKFETEDMRDSTDESRDPVLISVASFTLVNENPWSNKQPALQSKL
ncbi:unnamed protein product [Calypogeia fissa]